MSTNNSSGSVPKKPFLDWGLERLAFPPPNLFEMVDPPPPRPKGLFLEMLNGDPKQLLPYTETKAGMQDATALLHALLAGTRSLDSLHPEERMVLDYATAEMLTEPPVKRKVERPGAYVRKVLERRQEPEEQTEAETPPPTPGAFWWL
jgi:hypothetical protein